MYGDDDIVFMRIGADSTTSISGDGGYLNTVNNIYADISTLVESSTYKVGKIFVFDGNGPPGAGKGVITLNAFRNIEFGTVKNTCYDFVDWIDNNQFEGIHRCAIVADNAKCINMNSGSPTSNVGVYANYFDSFACDAWTGYTGRKGIVFGNSHSTVIENFFWSSAEWALADFIDDSAGRALSYYIVVTDDTNNTSRIKTYSKNMFHDGMTIEKAGTAKSNADLLTITNIVNAADMDGTGTGILFNQWYYNATTPAIADSGRIGIFTEQDWTSTASTQDSYMSFQTVLDGTVAEKMRITSEGNVGIGTTSPEGLLEVQGADGIDAVLVLDADRGDDVADTWFIKSQASDNDLVFYNHETQRFRIYDSGTVAIYGSLYNAVHYGSGTANATLTLAGNTAATGNTDGNDNLLLKVGNSGSTTAMAIENDGSIKIYAPDAETGTTVSLCYNTTTDLIYYGTCGGYTLESVQKLALYDKGLDYILKMQPYELNEIDSYSGEVMKSRRIGFVADEMPDDRMILREEKNPEILNDYDDRAVIATLVNAIKELKVEIDELRKSCSH